MRPPMSQEVAALADSTAGNSAAKAWPHSRDSAGQTRTMAREAFTPGKFVCPHGACFDHLGNIFVVEWVEAGRVTKLRKVA